MSSKKKTPIHLEHVTPDEKVKYEIAEELGLLGPGDAGWMEITYIQGNRSNRRVDHEKRNGKMKKMTKVLRMLISVKIV